MKEKMIFLLDADADSASRALSGVGGPRRKASEGHSTVVVLTMLVIAASALRAGAVGGQPESTRRSLTFEHVRSFFSDTLGIRATEVQKRCAIFYEGEWQNANAYRYCVIIVENSDEDLQVTFYITDDREMNWVNEFMDGPFFTRRETEELFRLLNRERHARGEKVGRFRVDVSHWMPRHAEIIVFSFTPLTASSR
jgi:hypothetical protein